MIVVQRSVEEHKVIAFLRNVPKKRLHHVFEALYTGRIRLAGYYHELGGL
jgi:hypothetical protein